MGFGEEGAQQQWQRGWRFAERAFLMFVTSNVNAINMMFESMARIDRCGLMANIYKRFVTL